MSSDSSIEDSSSFESWGDSDDYGINPFEDLMYIKQELEKQGIEFEYNEEAEKLKRTLKNDDFVTVRVVVHYIYGTCFKIYMKLGDKSFHLFHVDKYEALDELLYDLKLLQ